MRQYWSRTATAILGALYERFGRLLERVYAETIPLLINLLKDGDSQTRYEILLTFERLIKGLTKNGNQFQREIVKVAKSHLCDRKMPVRSAATRVIFPRRSARDERRMCHSSSSLVSHNRHPAESFDVAE